MYLSYETKTQFHSNVGEEFGSDKDAHRGIVLQKHVEPRKHVGEGE
jgi:hypothetical protein